MARSVLLADEASNGTGATVAWDGGEGILHGYGTWAGATVTLQYAPYSPVSGKNLTPSNTDVTVSETNTNQAFSALPAGRVRAIIAGGGGTESITVIMSRMK